MQSNALLFVYVIIYIKYIPVSTKSGYAAVKCAHRCTPVVY